MTVDCAGPLQDTRDAHTALEDGAFALAQSVEVLTVGKKAADRDASVDGLLVRAIVGGVEHLLRYIDIAFKAQE